MAATFNPAEFFAAAGADALTDWITTGIADLFGFGSTNSARKYNNEVLEKQQAFNRENMATQHTYDLESMKVSEAIAGRLFDKQNAYNTPEAQVKRLQEAGINPNVMFGGSNPVVSSSVPSAPIASGGLPSAPSGMNIPIQSISSGARDMLRLSNETKRNEGELSVLAKTLEGLEIDNLTKAEYLDIFKKTGLEKASKEVELLIMKAAEADATAKKMLSDKDLNGYKEKSEEASQALLAAKAKVEGKQAELLQIEIDNRDALIKSTIKSNEGSAASSYASAAVNRQEAHTKELYNKVYDKYNITNKEGINLFESAVISALRRPEVQNDLDEQTRKKIEDTLPVLIKQMEQDLENNDMRSWPAYIRLFGNLAGKTAADGLMFMLMK